MAVMGLVGLTLTVLLGPLSPTSIFVDKTLRYGFAEPEHFAIDDLRSPSSKQLMFPESSFDETGSISVSAFLVLCGTECDVDQRLTLQFTDTVFGFASTHDQSHFSHNEDKRFFFETSDILSGLRLHTASFISRECTAPTVSEDPDLPNSFRFTDASSIESYNEHRYSLAALFGVVVILIVVLVALLTRYVYKIVSIQSV